MPMKNSEAVATTQSDAKDVVKGIEMKNAPMQEVTAAMKSWPSYRSIRKPAGSKYKVGAPDQIQ